jgi:NAD(P)-dependent dehydrogenase (short-subunit alcohol dehydrogenase family)
MEHVEGKTAFITGGARGIGLGIAHAFARAEVKLAIADIDNDSLATAKSDLARFTAVETFNLDVRDREAYARVADEAEARLGPVSILCNNAGVAAATRFTYEFWDWMLGINLNGVINGIQTFMPRMIERGSGGHIVNTASGAGLVAAGTGVMYPTSKFAVVGLSEALRLELQSKQIGVSVLCPGPVATDIVSNSRSTQPAAQNEQEARIWEEATRQATDNLAHGVAPDKVGEMVLAAVKANRLYILTDRIMEKFIEARTKALLEALPPASSFETP